MADVAGWSGAFAPVGPGRPRDRRPVPWSPVFGGESAEPSGPAEPARSTPPAEPAHPIRSTPPAEPTEPAAPSPTDPVAASPTDPAAPSPTDPFAPSHTDSVGPTGTSVPRLAGQPSPEPGVAPHGAAEVAGGAPGPTRRRTRRTVLAVVAVVVVLGGGAALALGTLGLGLGPGGAVGSPAPTVVLPSPTPTVAPVPRQPVSAFADSLPGSVLDLALTSIGEHTPLLVAGAVEGYRLEYSDGGTETVSVTAGQWRTEAEAAAALAAMVAAAGPPAPAPDGAPTSGEVQVGGAVVGTWTITEAADGTGTVTWSNGTAVLQATGPADVLRDVYAAYPY